MRTRTRWIAALAIVVVVSIVVGESVHLTSNSGRKSFKSAVESSSSSGSSVPSKAPSVSNAPSGSSSPSSSLAPTKAPTNLQCHTSTIDRASLVSPGTPIIPPGYRLVQATIHSRHLDRWMYRHNFIDNICWTSQLNSTDVRMEEECQYNRSTVWQNFSFSSDPYAVPAQGNCNEKQLTMQGRSKSERLGAAYLEMFHNDLCNTTTNKIRLESSESAQKNQMTVQDLYRGMCNRDPDVTDFPAASVLYNGVQASGTPFFLRTSVCGSDFLQDALAEARAAFLQSDYQPRMRATAVQVANLTGKEVPADDGSIPTLLDNIYDCMVSHECHFLNDVPSGLWSIKDEMDVLETTSRLYAFDYFEARRSEKGREGEYERFVSNYFGYYFVTVLERMQKAVANLVIDSQPDPDVPMLYVQVTSDSIVSPQLRILGAPKSVYERRPVWGSQIVYQLLQDIQDFSFHVRILHEGDVLRMESLDGFAQFVDGIRPSVEDCRTFYDNFP